jgi:hypothetical protein
LDVAKREVKEILAFELHDCWKRDNHEMFWPISVPQTVLWAMMILHSHVEIASQLVELFYIH